MTVFRPSDSKTYRYSFYFRKQRYFGSTGQLTKGDAERWESKEKERIRQRLGGLSTPTAAESPLMVDWAEVYFEHVLTKADQITRPDRIEFLLRVILRFWGRRPSGKDPKDPVVEGEPYHNLRLLDPVVEPDWITRFEEWMDARGVGGQTKNQYRSTLRQLYQLALQPRWRKRTGVQFNPIDGIYRDRPGERDVTITPEQLRAVLTHASYHIRLAIAIGALAPKLRLENILGIRWKEHFDEGMKYITVRKHKTAGKTRRPLVIPVSEQLREILQDARRRNRGDHVIAYRGKPVHTITGGVRGAAKAAGVPYGRFTDDGVTFHTLRHTAATILAELDVAEGKRKSVMGHKHLGTTQKYTHLRPLHEVLPLEQLSAALQIKDVVTTPGRRVSRRRPMQGTVQLDSVTAADSEGNPPTESKSGETVKSA